MNTMKHCYAGGNTSIGYYSLFNELAPNLERRYILLGATSALKSSFLLRLAEIISEKGYAIELLHSLNEVAEVEGLIVPELQLGIIDGNSGHNLKPDYPGIRDIYINFDDAWLVEQLVSVRGNLLELYKQIESHLERVHQQFAFAKKAHEQKEKIYISAMDFTKANQVADQICSAIFASVPPLNTFGEERHFFLGASTSKGAINYIESLTERLSKRYIIKGRSGSGKSTLMRKIGKKAQELGYAIEYYHCSFDPFSLDMIIIPRLSVAVFDGTAPHVVDPSRASDEVVDMFALAIEPQVEVSSADDLRELDLIYRNHVQEAISALQDVKRGHVQLEELYRKCIDVDKLSALEERWIEKIVQYVEK